MFDNNSQVNPNTINNNPNNNTQDPNNLQPDEDYYKISVANLTKTTLKTSLKFLTSGVKVKKSTPKKAWSGFKNWWNK